LKIIINFSVLPLFKLNLNKVYLKGVSYNFKKGVSKMRRLNFALVLGLAILMVAAMSSMVGAFSFFCCDLGDDAEIVQIGVANDAYIYQKGVKKMNVPVPFHGPFDPCLPWGCATGGNRAEIFQMGYMNQSSISQTGALNDAAVDVFGVLNHVNITQNGALLGAYVGTGGYRNRVTIAQSGVLNLAMVGQVGGDNRATITQTAVRDTASILQMGHYNNATILQN